MVTRVSPRRLEAAAGDNFTAWPARDGEDKAIDEAAAIFLVAVVFCLVE